MRLWLLLLIPVFTAVSLAQTTKPGTGSVTGHVYCADTNAPARMASVQLKSIKTVHGQSGTHAGANNGTPVGGVVETALDGSFAIPNVPPGSYYVVVTAAGYLSPRPDDDQETDPKPQPGANQPPVVIPKVDVQADQAANLDIRLERGAAISGNIRFDDGSPATNVLVMVMRKKKDQWETVSHNDYGAFAMPSSLTTDDLGHYRIGGLPNGEYIVSVTLVHVDMTPVGTHTEGLSGALRSVLIIYSGDTMRKSQAVSFKLGPGEDRAGMDIAIPLSKLHSVSGVVTAVSDGHPINSGHLSIEDPEDKESIVEAELDRDGAFHLDGVPEGSYMLHIQNPSDKQEQQVSVAGGMQMTSEKILHQYGDLEQAIKIEGDIPNLVLSVQERKSEGAGTGSQ
jgi:hypothetical protein